jgi:hypothetical protein
MCHMPCPSHFPALISHGSIYSLNVKGKISQSCKTADNFFTSFCLNPTIWNKIPYIFLKHSAAIFTDTNNYDPWILFTQQGIRLYLITNLYHDCMFRQLNSHLNWIPDT